jgi:putative autotransporter adhesin-like protein
MRTISIFVSSVMVLFLGACGWEGIRGNGHVITEKRDVGPFTEIHGSGGLKVEWQSGPPSLTITTDDNLLSYIETRNVGNQLEIRSRERIHPTKGTKIFITSASLSAAQLSGAADLIAHSLSGPRFSVQTSGAASITLDGVVDQLFADLTGASDLKAKSLQAKVVEMSTTGAADAWVSVSDTLRVAITGAGDVAYSGNPKTVEKHVTGAGSIRRKE